MPDKYDFWKHKYPEEEIRNYIKNNPKRCDWSFWFAISEYQTLSEYFIREFQDEVRWGCISEKQELSEDFIREFQDKVNWYDISKYQNLSEKFLIEFIDEIEIGDDNFYGLIANKKISEKVKNRIINLKKVRNA